MPKSFDEIMELLGEGSPYLPRIALLNELGQLAWEDKEAELKLYELAEAEKGRQELEVILKSLLLLSKKSQKATDLLKKINLPQPRRNKKKHSYSSYRRRA